MLTEQGLIALDWVSIGFNGSVLLLFIYLLFRSVMNKLSVKMGLFAYRVINFRGKVGCCSWGVRAERAQSKEGV